MSGAVGRRGRHRRSTNPAPGVKDHCRSGNAWFARILASIAIKVRPDKIADLSRARRSGLAKSSVVERVIVIEVERETRRASVGSNGTVDLARNRWINLRRKTKAGREVLETELVRPGFRRERCRGNVHAFIEYESAVGGCSCRGYQRVVGTVMRFHNHARHAHLTGFHYPVAVAVNPHHASKMIRGG